MLSWRHANLLQIWEVNITKPTRYKWGLRAAWWDVPGWLVFYVPSGTYCFIGHWNVWTTTGHPLVPRVLRHATPLHLQIKWRILIWCFRLSDPDLAIYLTRNWLSSYHAEVVKCKYIHVDRNPRKQSSWGSSWHHERVVFSFICRWSIARNLKPHLVEKKCQWWWLAS